MMAPIPGSAAPHARPRRPPSLGRGIPSAADGRMRRDCAGALAHRKRQDEPARDPIRRLQSNIEGVAQAENAAGAPADEAVLGFLVKVKIAGKVAHRQQTVGAALVERHEEPERVTPLTRPWKVAPMRWAR